MIDAEQKQRLVEAARSGLGAIHRPPPMRLSEWADENFYLSSESSYVEGRWETEPFQRAIMDCISNDDIREINMIKSARVGYSQILRAAIGYFAEHKKRNQLFYLPNDDPAKMFMRQQVETMIRDVPAVKALCPWFGKKDKASTEKIKNFSNGRALHVRGGAAAKNYRELSVDVVGYDELDGFDLNIEQEGDCLTLGDKRIEGSVFPRTIRGSTPKLEKTSLIQKAVNGAQRLFRYHVPCPHCGHMQHLKFGGRHAPYGLKITKDEAGEVKTVEYLCEGPGCGVLITYAEMQKACRDPRARWQDDAGVWIDADCYFRSPSGEVVDTPVSVAFHIWTVYSPWTTWVQIARDWLAAQGDVTKLQTFVNTTLGEVYREKGERLDAASLVSRAVEFPVDRLPDGVAVLAGSVDTQKDRLEYKVIGIGAGDQVWVLDYARIIGDPKTPVPWLALDAIRRRIYTRADGVQLHVARWCVDTGGDATESVYEYCRTRFAEGVLAIKGMPGEGRPIIGNPTKTNLARIPLYPIGTMTVKDHIFGRLNIMDPGPGYFNFNARCCDELYFDGLTSEELRYKLVNGETKRIYEKISPSRRNEPLDLMGYALAAYYSLNIRVDELLAAPTDVPQRRVRDHGIEGMPAAPSDTPQVTHL